MTWLALLTNKYVAMFGAAVILCAGMFFFGAHWQSKRDAPKLIAAQVAAQSAVSANTANLSTIADLESANAAFAAQAAASEARATKAVQAVADQQKASSAALARVNRKLEDALHATPTAAAWGRACVPAGVFAAGGVQPGAGCPH